MQPVRVIAGLGNPGTRYDGTRHNIGFAVVDKLAARFQVKWKSESRFCAHTATIDLANGPVLLVKPQTYMNASGKTIGELCRYFRWKPEEFLVAYDEYQLPLGKVKVSVGGGDGGHNGITDIIARVGNAFVRYRIGIAPEVKPRASLTDFVLGKFTGEETTKLASRWDALADGLNLVVEKGPLLAMNQLNQRIPNT